MVLVIVFVHAVASDEVQVRITVFELLPNCSDVARVIVVVNRIRFFLTNNTAVDKSPSLARPILISSRFASFDQVAISSNPKGRRARKQKYSRP